MWRSWLYVYQHDLATADFFVKIDDDSLVFVDNLRRFLVRGGFAARADEPWWIGSLPPFVFRAQLFISCFLMLVVRSLILIYLMTYFFICFRKGT